MVLMDKGYYDYDYSEVDRKEERKFVTIESTRKSDEEIRNILGAFGWGRELHTAGELQELVIKDINERANAHK